MPVDRKFHASTCQPKDRVQSMRLTQPQVEIKAPASMAPRETPMVKPELTKPRYKPLLFSGAMSRTIMIVHATRPAPPIPVMALPARKPANVGASPVTMLPRANIKLAVKRHTRGEKILHNRPSRGDVLDMAIF